MERFVIAASPWLCALLAAWYWLVLVKEETLRHYVLTGKRWPPLRERRQIVLVKSKKTHFYGWTATLLTFTLVNMVYRPHPAGVGINVALLLIYLFVALWCGPMLRIVPTLEGVMLMAAVTNGALYLSVHSWTLGWTILQFDSFLFVVILVGLIGLLQLLVVYGNRRTASCRRPPPRHSP